MNTESFSEYKKQAASHALALGGRLSIHSSPIERRRHEIFEVHRIIYGSRICVVRGGVCEECQFRQLRTHPACACRIDRAATRTLQSGMDWVAGGANIDRAEWQDCSHHARDR